MDKVQSEKMMAEMNAFLAESGNGAVSGNEMPETEDLPFESLDDFSTDPMEFGELASRMAVKVETIFDLSVMYNRHSPKYLKACAMLEKGIKYLACCCITRVALKRNHDLNAGPDDLSTEKLYRMASFNYRKLDTAHTEKLAKSCELYPELTDMVFRYFNLLLRLRSTEAKIYKNNFRDSYGPQDHTPEVQGLAFTPKSWNRRYNERKPDREPVFHKAPSFPVLRDVVESEAKTARKSAPVSRAKAEENCREETPVVTEAGAVKAEAVLMEGLPALPPAAVVSETAEVPSSANEEKTAEPEAALPKSETKPEDPQMIWGLPDFRDILKAARLRSRRGDEGFLEFTYQEMLILSADQEFRACYPDLAKQIRREVIPQIFLEEDSG